MELAFLFALLTGGVALLGMVVYREQPRGPLQTVELHFNADLTTDAIEAMLAGIAGLRSNTAVLLDTMASEHGVRYFLRAPQQTLDTLRSQWRGVAPGLRMESVNDLPEIRWRTSAQLRLAGSRPVLRGDGSGAGALLTLAAMMPLGSSEHLLLRWCLGSGAHPSLPVALSRREANRTKTGLAHLLLDESTPQAAHVRALRVKYAGPVLSGAAVVAVDAGHPKRAAHLGGRVIAAMRSRGGAWGHLVTRRCGQRRTGRLLARTALARRDLYAPSELVGLLPLPVGGPQLPGVTLGAAPVLMPSPRIPVSGRVLARSNWPGSDRALSQPVVGGLSHSLLVGPTGVGKSELLASLAVQDLSAGRGLLLVDGKGDGATALLERVPDHRVSDVIVLDPAAELPVPGLRLFSEHSDPQLAADLVLGIFADLFAESWGPLSARWLRAGLLLLAGDREATLADFPFVFSDERFRRRLAARLESDPLARETWRAFEAMGQPERTHQLAAPLQKVEELVARRVIRSVVGQSAPKLDMGEVLAKGKVVVVSLGPGRLGATAARLLGALVIFKFFEAVQARAALPPSERRPFFAYIDEPAVLADVPLPLDSLFELARGMGVGVTLAAQSLAQLPDDVRAAAQTNAATVLSFRQHASSDARLLAAELGVAAEGLQSLGRFEAVMRIGLGPGDVAPAATGVTLPLAASQGDAEAVRRASAERYGIDPAEVDAALIARHAQSSDDQDEPPVGRIRRRS